MDSKLKQLKVAQLKEILQQAGVAFKERDNKTELISKILASSEATSIANGGKAEGRPSASATTTAPATTTASADDDLLAPPEDFDWEETTAAAAAAAAAAPPTSSITGTEQKITNVTSNQAPIPAPATQNGPTAATTKASKDAAAPSTNNSTATSKEDEEDEKRKQRASRFGIPYVEPKVKQEAKPKKVVAQAQNGAGTGKTNGKPVDDVEKLEARAARFNGGQLPASDEKGKKRTRSPPPVDTEEAERRLKRAQRFGLTTEKTQ